MRIAVISDIHGNSIALDAALHDIEGEHVDQIVCLGDIVTFGPHPVEATQRVQALGCPVIMGNTDDWILDEYPKERPSVLDESEALFYWCADQLSTAEIDFLRTFHPALTVPFGSKTILCYHGSPRLNDEVILASTPDDDLEPMFSGCDEAVFIGGHTHIQMLRRWHNRLVLNPGSIGIPVSHVVKPGAPRRYHPFAEYALLAEHNGLLNVEFRRVPYDLNALRADTHRSGMPYAEWWLEKWDAPAI